jgi:uncharacterized protein (DUF433 family)
VPDYQRASPKLWSYRDLVFLRLLARMRQHGFKRDQAAKSVVRLRTILADPSNVLDTVRVGDGGLFLGDESRDLLSGQQASQEILTLTQPFDLLEPVEGVNRHPTWGPDLVEPSAHTYISPAVMGREPCVDSTRVPSASILALVEQRGLNTAQIVRLYPRLSDAGVEDAVELERRMRHTRAA